MNARNRQKPICWKHLDGWIFFIHWSRLKMHKLPPAKNCSSISSEIQWIFMVRCPCKTTKEAARDWKEKKDYMKNKKKNRSKSVSIFTQKLFFLIRCLGISSSRSLDSDHWTFCWIFRSSSFSWSKQSFIDPKKCYQWDLFFLSFGWLKK